MEGGAQAESVIYLSGEHRASSPKMFRLFKTVYLYFQAMLRKKSIILNTSKQLQVALREPKVDVTDTWNCVFPFVFFPLLSRLLSYSLNLCILELFLYGVIILDSFWKQK